MQRFVVTLAVGGALAFVIFFAIGMSGARIFPCERAVTADGSFYYGYGRKPMTGYKATECRLGTRNAKYSGAAYGMMAGMFGVFPLLIGFIFGTRARRKEPRVNTASKVMASLSIGGGVYALVQVGMRGRGADMEIMLGVLGGACLLGLISAIISRGGQKTAIGGVILTVATLVLSGM